MIRLLDNLKYYDVCVNLTHAFISLDKAKPLGERGWKTTDFINRRCPPLLGEVFTFCKIRFYWYRGLWGDFRTVCVVYCLKSLVPFPELSSLWIFAFFSFLHNLQPILQISLFPL